VGFALDRAGAADEEERVAAADRDRADTDLAGHVGSVDLQSIDLQSIDLQSIDLL
jgi:hypothetical protein